MNKPVSKNLSGQLLQSAAKFSRVASPRGGVFAFKDLIVEGLVDDGLDVPPELLPIADHDKPLQVKVSNWDEVEEGLVIALYVDGGEALEGKPGAYHSVTREEAENPDHEFPLALPSSFWDAVNDGEDRTLEVGYSVRPEFSSEYERGPKRVIRIDKKKPGGNPGTLSKLSFPAEIESRGHILMSDFSADSLRVHVSGYLAQKQGDLITVSITDGTTVVPVGPFTVVSSSDATPLDLPLVELQKLQDKTKITFSYTSTDRAGNLSSVSVAHDSLQLLLQDIPAVLPTPEVLGFDQPDSPLILDNDARNGIRVTVPEVEGPRVGDKIVVLWGSQRSEGHEIKVVSPTGPLMEIDLLYPFTITGPQTGYVDVSYELWREGVYIDKATSAATVEVDLRLPGGLDPEPELPAHGNLKLATIVGDVSEVADNLTPEDVQAGAKLTIPWLAVNGDELLQDGDKLQLVWGTRLPYSLDPVSNAEAVDKKDIVRNVPASVLATEPSGVVWMAYTVTREFGAGGEENTALSRAKSVTVLRASDLPGEGAALEPLEFTDLNRFGAIDIQKAQQPLPVRIPLYANALPYDKIFVHLRADDSQRATPGKPIPDAEQDLDFIPLLDHHIAAGELTLEIPRKWAFIVCSGSATVEYTAKNGHGPVKAAHTRVPVTVRQPSQPNCPLP